DLWALGVTLLETLQLSAALHEPQLLEAQLPEAQLPEAQLPPARVEPLPPDLRRILTGLLSPSAATRTRARWVSSMAGYTSRSVDHELAIRRHYLAAQGEFLERVSEGRNFEMTFGGQPAEWLRRAGEVMRRLPTVFAGVSPA